MIYLKEMELAVSVVIAQFNSVPSHSNGKEAADCLEAVFKKIRELTDPDTAHKN